jgi:hypothetical protein
MNCHDFWDNLPPSCRQLTAPQAEHLAVCAACATQWEPHRALAMGLHAMGQEWRKQEAPPRVEAGLTAAFRSQTAFQVRRSLHHSWWTPVFAWASAAAAMVALAVLTMHGSHPAPVKPGTVATPRRSVQSMVQTASAVLPGDADTDDAASVLGDGFVRLPNAPSIDPNEDFNVVRVEVPGSAIIAMGVSVSEERASETLLADVALGADGTARAVRLVPDSGTF